MGPNLYSQTPGALHMGGGVSSPFAHTDLFYGNIYGPSNYGNAAAGFASNLPGYAMNAGMIAGMASGMGIGGAGLQRFGQIFGLSGLGLAGSTLAMAPLQYMASQATRAHRQNMMTQGTMRRVFGERDMGGVHGMGVSRQGMQGYTAAFREMVNSMEMLTNDTELNNVINKFSDMRLLETSRSVSEMTSRVKKLSRTVREISLDLGTTLEGAMPAMQRHVQMGFTDADAMRQSIRTNRALRGAGIVMDDSTITSFEMSQAAANFAAGGRKEIGARGAQQMLGQASVAAAMGILTDEDLVNATGKRGQEAVADFSQRAMQASRNVMQSGYGRMLSAALGEVDDQGRFTGRMDEKMREQFKSMSAEEIQQIANRKLQGRGATSFHRRMRSGMGADFGSMLGTGEFSSVLDKIFKDDDEMFAVLEQLTNMRGQALETLIKFQREGETITRETERRVSSNAMRNRLRSVVERDLTLGGRMNTAYRRFIAEPIGQPLQTAFGAMGDSVGNYFDNYGRQIMRHGVFGGIGRGLFGVGRNDGLATQSFEDRMSSINSFDERFSGEANQNVLVGAAGDERISRLREVFDDMNVTEREFTNVRGGGAARLTLLGTDVDTFMKAREGDTQLRYHLGHSIDNADFMQALALSVEAADKGQGMDYFLEEVLENLKGRASGNQVEAVNKSGGLHGVLRHLDKNYDAYGLGGEEGKGQRVAVQKALDMVEGHTSSFALAESKEASLDIKRDANTAINKFIEAADGTGDGFQYGLFGGSDVVTQIEDTFLANLANSGNTNKLRTVLDGLRKAPILKRLRGINLEDTDEEIAASLTKIFGMKFSKGDASEAKALLKQIKKGILDAGSEEEFAKYMGGMSTTQGVGAAIAQIDKKLAEEKNQRAYDSFEEIDRSKLEAGDKQKAREAIVSYYRGGAGGARQLSELLGNEDMKLDGDLGKAASSYQAFVKGGDAATIRRRLKEKMPQLTGLDSLNLEQLKERAAQVAYDSQSFAGASSEAKDLLQTGTSNPQEAAKLILEASEAMRVNIAKTQQHTGTFIKTATNSIKELQTHTGVRPS